MPPVRLRRSSGLDRTAVVSVEPSAWNDGRFMIRVARGKGGKTAKLLKGTTYGPFLESELATRFEEAVANLEAEGFVRLAGDSALLEALAGDDRARRARAALLLGWRRSPAAVEPLLGAAEGAVDEICSLVDALGAIGDPRAIPLARKLATRKLLSRRRSGVEALRVLGDAAGLAEARQAGLERLPPAVAAVLAATDELDDRDASVAPLVAAVLEEEEKRQGLVIDTLYELGTPATEAAARLALLQLPIGRLHHWRYAKSVLKRSMLRHDARTFGALAHAVEAAARTTKGTKATVKSGYDGVSRETPVFSRKTVTYVRRLAWRYLRLLARHRPERYAGAAAEALVAYAPADAQLPRGLAGAYADCYLLNRILWDESPRLRLDERSLRFKFKSSAAASAAPKGREDAYPELWDAHPRAFLRVLAGARLPEVQRFGLDGLSRHPAVLVHASGRELVGMLESGAAEVVALAATELERRFTQGVETPDFDLLEALLGHARQDIWAIACRWLEQHPDRWIDDADRVVRFLGLARGAALERFGAVCVTALATAPTAAREALADRALAALRTTPASDDAHQGFARVAREALLAELDRRLSLGDVLAMVATGSIPARTVAAALLGRRPDALEAIGLAGVLGLAESEVVAVRGAAQALLRSGLDALRRDPAPLFSLIESRWADNHAAAFALLEQVDVARLGLDGVIGICDSTQPDAQEFGRTLIRRHFEELDVQDLLFKLVEHPDRAMQRFALELVRDHLRDGFVPLARIEPFCRTCLLDLKPDRALKGALVDFLVERGLRDERQGELVAAVLGDVVRSHTRADFERVAEALVRLQLAWPGVTSALMLAAPAGGGEHP